MKEKSTEKTRTIKSMLGTAFDIPADIISGVPRFVLLGNELLTVENHKGIMKYGQNEILLNSVLGMIEITGKDLELRSILPDELQISGRIEGIFVGRED